MKELFFVIVLFFAIVNYSCVKKTQEVKNKDVTSSLLEDKYFTDTVFYNESQIKSITSYKNDLKHGKETMFDSLYGYVSDFYYYIDGVREGEGFKSIYKKSMHSYIYDNGEKKVESIYLKDEKGRPFFHFYDYIGDSSFFVGTLYEEEVVEDIESYYLTGEVFDTISNGENYNLEILTIKHNNEEEARFNFVIINNKDTIDTIDTIALEESVSIPIKNYQVGINKIKGYIQYYYTDSLTGSPIIHQMYYYKWLFVE